MPISSSNFLPITPSPNPPAPRSTSQHLPNLQQTLFQVQWHQRMPISNKNQFSISLLSHLLLKDKTCVSPLSTSDTQFSTHRRSNRQRKTLYASCLEERISCCTLYSCCQWMILCTPSITLWQHEMYQFYFLNMCVWFENILSSLLKQVILAKMFQ